MGVWGWDEIQDGVTLKGVAVGKANYHGDDGDWTFSVNPAPDFKHLLTNPSGFKNTNGLIECEVQPPFKLNGDNAESQETADKHLNNGDRKITNKWVIVRGTWVRDRSHSFAGETIGAFDDGNKGKTEIHPIISILIEHPPAPDNRSRVVDFLVFSSAGSVHRYVPSAPSAPHTDENRLGAFDILVPRSCFGQPSSFSLVSELDMSDSKSEFKIFFVDSGPSYHVLQGRVRSGRVSAGEGFYHAIIKVHPGYTLRTYLSSRGVDPRFGIRGHISKAGVSSVRALFQQF